MKTAYEEIKKLRLLAEKSFKKTDELDRLLTQLEVKLATAEALKISATNKSTQLIINALY